LENLTVADYLKGFRVLLLTYNGMKLEPEVHAPLADWVRKGGALVSWMTTPIPTTRFGNGGTATG
jgi:hypothetical protein